jgi:hypothetical protein
VTRAREGPELSTFLAPLTSGLVLPPALRVFITSSQIDLAVIPLAANKESFKSWKVFPSTGSLFQPDIRNVGQRKSGPKGFSLRVLSATKSETLIAWHAQAKLLIL